MSNIVRLHSMRGLGHNAGRAPDPMEVARGIIQEWCQVVGEAIEEHVSRYHVPSLRVIRDGPTEEAIRLLEEGIEFDVVAEQVGCSSSELESLLVRTWARRRDYG